MKELCFKFYVCMFINMIFFDEVIIYKYEVLLLRFNRKQVNKNLILWDKKKWLE